MMDLFRGYDTDARASTDTQATVTVKIQYMLLRIQRLVCIYSLCTNKYMLHSAKSLTR